MWAQRVQINGENVIGTKQTFNAHCGGNVSELEQPPQIDDREHQHAEHPVGAVDQGQALLLGQSDRRYARGSERIARR
jgi:hypothetical protein